MRQCVLVSDMFHDINQNCKWRKGMCESKEMSKEMFADCNFVRMKTPWHVLFLGKE